MLQQLLNSQIDRHNNECLVKVAILSSGVDETSALVSAAAGRGRLEARDFTGSKSCADELGLGTHSINMMLYLTKYVKIYAAKVATNIISQKAIASPVCMVRALRNPIQRQELNALTAGSQVLHRQVGCRFDCPPVWVQAIGFWH